MTDDPLTAAELAEVRRMRIGKPLTTSAQPQDSYRNPAICAKYVRERIERERRERWRDEK